MILLITHSKSNNKKLYVCFIDYEKAFDFANRPSISNHLMKKGCGKFLTSAITKTLLKSVYYPKITNNRLGEGIVSEYGVTQGRKTSSNLFSFYLSDMSTAFINTRYNDFMQPCDFTQLADDTAIYAEYIESLRSKCKEIFDYSDRKYQILNLKKTKYCEFSSNPTMEKLTIDEKTSIASVDTNQGYSYLGMTFIPTNDMKKIIEKNINKKLFNVAKFYGWLEINITTPIEIKLRILDNCMFSALLYGSETWGDFTYIYEKLRKIERKAIKAILKVKSGTTNDLVFHELHRGDIVSKIKDRQCNFFKKISQLQYDDAIIKSIIEICKNDEILRYYANLHNHNYIDDIKEREIRINTSNNSLAKYYVEMAFINRSCIYNSFLNDDLRGIITRWRLSNHCLKIETGRYIGIPRNERVCDTCDILEDEHHVIFVCTRYAEIRQRFANLINKNNDIKLFLNPSFADCYETATFLYEIEAIRDK